MGRISSRCIFVRHQRIVFLGMRKRDMERGDWKNSGILSPVLDRKSSRVKNSRVKRGSLDLLGAAFRNKSRQFRASLLLAPSLQGWGVPPTVAQVTYNLFFFLSLITWNQRMWVQHFSRFRHAVENYYPLPTSRNFSRNVSHLFLHFCEKDFDSFRWISFI